MAKKFWDAKQKRLETLSTMKKEGEIKLMAKAKLGSGARFAALKSKIASKGNVKNPGAVAAFIGRKKYGKKKFQQLSLKGRLKHKGKTIY